MRYRQCRLCTSRAGNAVETTVFIPEKYAVVGKVVRLKQGETWTDGWQVTFAGELMSGEFIENQAHNCCAIWKPSASLTNRGKK